jgi:hypothetical protein
MPTASKCAFHRPSFLPSPHGTKSTERKDGFGGMHADLRKQFLEIARKHSPEPRTVYCFMTTAVVRTLPIWLSFIRLFTFTFFFFWARVIAQDTRAMASTLSAIRVGIVNDNLQSAELLR